jgi:phosphatidate cytidylyltransferase
VLAQRILSALVLAPLAGASAWVGSWFFVCLVAACGGILAWEWNRLCLGRFGPGGLVLAAMVIAVAALALRAPLWSLAAILLSAAPAALVQRVPGRSSWWMIGGAFYIGLPILALIWVRSEGRATLFWLLAVVWATDIGAYAAGRAIGGPKLLPRVSPHKTWAGLAGGAVSAAAVGGLAAVLLNVGALLLTLASAALAMVAQAGDLGESWIKRRFGVKDASGIIPGHGGMLDRVDGLLAAAPVVALLCLLLGGGIGQWH